MDVWDLVAAVEAEVKADTCPVCGATQRWPFVLSSKTPVGPHTQDPTGVFDCLDLTLEGARS